MKSFPDPVRRRILQALRSRGRSPIEVSELSEASGAASAPRSLPGGWWVLLFGLTMILFWASVPTLVGIYDLPPHLAFAAATLQCATLPLTIRFPYPAVALHVVSIVLIGEIVRGDADSFWPVPIANLVALTLFLVILGLRERWYFAVAAWWLSFLGMTVVVMLDLDDLARRPEWDEDVLISITVTLLAVVIAVSVGQRRRIREDIRSARRDLELEQAKRATIEERARIARELHDVVAHSMSIVHIQAESARFRVTSLEQAHGEFGDIARSARAALAEMRQLLSTLHPAQEDAVYAPQPGIADIPALITGAQAIGADIELVSELGSHPLSPIVELTVYRIVQEALSNALRHAPGAAVSVRLSGDEEAVDIRVHNGPGTAAARRDAPPDTGGQGLRGMRERVAVLHGVIEQSPLPDGGFLISARLPTGS